MLSPISFLTNPNVAGFVQNSSAQVLSEGCLKAVGRPVFTLMDKTADENQKKYSATKEFIYQSLSMLSYFLLIFPIKNNSHKLLKKFPQLKNYNKENSSLKATSKEIEQVLNAKDNNAYKQCLSKITDKEFVTKVKGAQELMSIVASGVILAVVAPRVVNNLVHPIMDKVFKNNKSSKNIDEIA